MSAAAVVVGVVVCISSSDARSCRHLRHDYHWRHLETKQIEQILVTFSQQKRTKTKTRLAAAQQFAEDWVLAKLTLHP